jgi:radical SAM protein with 4Fe4S-binding SPASM domain
MNCAHIEWPDDKAYFREFFRRAEAARVPLAGTLELTRRCNLRCLHCYLPRSHGTEYQGPQERVHGDLGREMTTAQVLMIVDQLVAAGCLSLLITGGDPLLQRDFAEIYRHAKLAGVEVTVFTNGTLVTDRVVELFQDLPPRVVEISLYGATAETYERITGVPGSFRRCLAGIRRLHDGGIRLGLKTLLMTANSHELEAIEGLARSYGAKFRFDPVLNACLDGGREPLSLRLDVDEVVQLEFASRERRQGWIDFHTKYPEIAPADRLLQCGAGETLFHVDAFGNLQPCLMLPGASFSLLTGTFAEGWTQIASVRETRVSEDNRCSSCQRRPYCAYCPGLLALENGDPEIPSAYLCALGTERLRAVALFSQGEE